MKYILAPGYVRSASDGDLHFIGADALACLYGVRMRDCAVLPLPRGNGTLAPWDKRRADELLNTGLPVLRPRANGNYTLPGSP